MKKIYFDFDGTLYNSNKLTDDFYNIFVNYGLSKDKIKSIKKELFKNKIFNLDILTDFVINNYGISDKIKMDIDRLYKNDYLYDDVMKSIDKLKEKYQLIILTYGSYKYQMNKINGSNINKYIKDIIVTENDKSKLDIVDYNNSIFIDNNPSDILRFSECKPYKLIRIRRDDDKYRDVDTTINTLEYNNLYDIIDKELL